MDDKNASTILGFIVYLILLLTIGMIIGINMEHNSAYKQG